MGPLGPALALACRIVLAGVLAVAAVAKIADRRALPGLLRALGLAEPWDARLATGLPIVELAVAVALVGALHSPVPAIAAVGLLGAFTVFLVAGARRGVPCPCFGAVRTANGGTAAGAVLRNGVLIALGVVATGSAHGARAGGTVVLTLIGAVVAALAVTRVA
jgi:hypothetical protein